MTNAIVASAAQTQPQDFLKILSGEPFTGLRAILLGLGSETGALRAAIQSARSYEELIKSLGYRITLTNQIHIQDCYSRVGPAGGIKAVLPCYDIPTQASLPTLVNFDRTITTTPKSVAFFNNRLAALKTELNRSKPVS
jgi:hypothetical protein